MMKQTIAFNRRLALRARASCVGPKEGKGPLGWCFDRVLKDDLLGQATWELAESEMLRQTVSLCLERGGLMPDQLELLASGDLLNQLMPSCFMARALGRPFMGLYGACSTFVEAMILCGVMIDGGYRKNAVCAASSHFCTAERQFRSPLELGTQRPPSAQWTATAAGAALMDTAKAPAAARLTHGTLGRVIDYEVTDANHMGAAMAPAVADTILAHFRDTGRDFRDYDRVITGDLGWIGRRTRSWPTAAPACSLRSRTPMPAAAAAAAWPPSPAAMCSGKSRKARGSGCCWWPPARCSAPPAASRARVFPASRMPLHWRRMDKWRFF